MVSILFDYTRRNSELAGFQQNTHTHRWTQWNRDRTCFHLINSKHKQHLRFIYGRWFELILDIPFTVESRGWWNINKFRFCNWTTNKCAHADADVCYQSCLISFLYTHTRLTALFICYGNMTHTFGEPVLCVAPPGSRCCSSSLQLVNWAHLLWHAPPFDGGETGSRRPRSSGARLVQSTSTANSCAAKMTKWKDKGLALFP